MSKRHNPITVYDLKGLSGLSCKARQAIIEMQPRTVREALTIPGVAGGTTRNLVPLGLLADPEGVHSRRGCLPPDFASKRRRPLTIEDLRGINGLRRKTRDTLIAIQPATAFEALILPGIGRGIAGLLFKRGLLVDPERCLEKNWAFFWRLVVDRGLKDVLLVRWL